ncbi:E3 ubiquitin-protein ligase TRIM38-like [Poeciliopsis prolifica]|uniref:E3 ubiquitin-protein ligase TRIM38-like n=1 Tax=Poeciliopsis prolifica TaxID=188132 RepID=UPI0024143849|nr:E3 ubiquitin-protein ligase TRIM38-like [Poeciliopsis prolifica]
MKVNTRRKSEGKNRTGQAPLTGAAQQPADMTAAAESIKDDCFLKKHLTCPICMETFTDPVTTSCGHSFCMRCLELSVSSFQVDDACPLCKRLLKEAPKVNNVLRDIVKEVKRTLGQKFAGAAGEVPCDSCTVPQKKAVKSCLVCVASFCSAHLQNHYFAKRLKGHKLVEPVENLDTRACPTHGCPLELYCRKQQTCVCARCLDGGHGEVVSAEEEWQVKKDQIENTKAELQERIMTRKAKIDEINEALKSCEELVTKEWWDIDALFRAVVDVVKAAKAEALNPLEDKLRFLDKESKNLKDELEDEINKLETTISKLDDISALEDHVLFLQRYPSVSVQDVKKDWKNIELDTTLSFGSMRETATTMIENIQQQLEKLAAIELMRFPKFEVDVRLDPETAHCRLVFSNNGSKVEDRGENREVADSPKRYDVLGSVLGLNTLATGKSYWEVEVGSTTGWDLGVARGSANRRGRQALNPENGYWVLVHFEECDVPKPFTVYAVMTAPPVSLSIKDKPKKIGVFVDYEEGIVSFYDVTARSHIYSFSKCSFQDELRPYFSLHMKYEMNFEPLTISKIKH